MLCTEGFSLLSLALKGKAGQGSDVEACGHKGRISGRPCHDVIGAKSHQEVTSLSWSSIHGLYRWLGHNGSLKWSQKSSAYDTGDLFF